VRNFSYLQSQIEQVILLQGQTLPIDGTYSSME